MSLKFQLFSCLIQQVLNCDRATVVQEAHESALALVFIHNIADFLLHCVTVFTGKIIQGVINQ